MIYRELQSVDLKLFKADILSLLVDSYIINFRISPSKAELLCLEKIKLLDRYILDGSAIVIGCVCNNQLIGFTWLYLHEYFGEKRLHVNEIVVDEKYRGKGIGKKFIDEAEKIASKLHVETIDLFVSEINTEALKLYIGIGFKTERRYMKKDVKVRK